MTTTEAAYHTGAKAAQLAAQMTGWLMQPITATTPLEPIHCWPDPAAAAELIEWCRAARDTLADVAAQAPKSYSPGHPAPFSPADHDQAAAVEEYDRLLAEEGEGR